MGFTASGDIADAAVYTDFELGLLHNQLVQDFEVTAYARYKDDLFFVMRTGRNLFNFSNALAARKMSSESPFEIVKWEVHGTHMQFLDVTVFKGPRWRATGHVDIKPYTKSTAAHIPLSHTSLHPPATWHGPRQKSNGRTDIQHTPRMQSQSWSDGHQQQPEDCPGVSNPYFATLCHTILVLTDCLGPYKKFSRRLQLEP
eukprot:6491606-Amphidinium_carterae.1